jgi:hypothetical protein
MKVGDVLTDRQCGSEIGVITSMDVKPARSFTVNSDGQYVLTSMPFRSHLTITVEGVGGRPREGGLHTKDGWHGFVNVDFMLNIGDAAFFMRFFEFELDTDVLIERVG